MTNGLGGFASATLAMTPSRRYHGLLIAAESDARTVVVNRLDESLVSDGEAIELGGWPEGATSHIDFHLDLGLPVWTIHAGSFALERRIHMDHGANAVHVRYRLLKGAAAVQLRLQPWFQVRSLEDDITDDVRPLPLLHATGGSCALRIDTRMLTLRAHPKSGQFVAQPGATSQHYPMEAARGYASEGRLWSPGWFEVKLEVGGVAGIEAILHAGAEPGAASDHGDAVERERRIALLAAAPDVTPDLVLAADQFLVTRRPSAPAEVRGADGVIAGYHWFGRWGRDTMISLDGLALHTGRAVEAAAILREALRHMRRGLIPNYFPDRGEPLYHTADATLWLFHAIHRLHVVSGDATFISETLPALRDIIRWHVQGTDFNIRVDPVDGLLTQGVDDLPLTWMDAKVGDWVVTPRRGKAVELQGLWYNALHLMASWESQWGDPGAAGDLARRADLTRASFNRRFWNDREEQLFDVVDGDDGDDSSCRPNQLLAFSLEHSVLDAARCESVLAAVEADLVTPVGLRSLSPRDAGYQPRYDGDRRNRDAAYHQGTVWPWLVGPYADACRRARHDDSTARAIAQRLISASEGACIGQIAEIHDAEAPYAPRGCVAQAWSVSEVIRCRPS